MAFDWTVDLLWLTVGGIMFTAGICLTAYAGYLFLKKRRRHIYIFPAWMVVLGLGLAMTLVLPGIIAFLLFSAHRMPEVITGPPVMCYDTVPYVPTNATATASSTPYPYSTQTQTPLLSALISALSPGGETAAVTVIAGSGAEVIEEKDRLVDRLYREGKLPEQVYRKIKRVK
ncbi:MAG TPA: hypothetical protein VK436_06860 [Methanocella sp.]|nr:hypothetical protein [Methanocella sp.]